MTNEADLLSALRQAFPGVLFDAFNPGSTPELSFLEVASCIYGARVIIGPHGANLNNQMAARPGAWLVEVGYDGGMVMPSDFFGLARNLGLRYWLSPSSSGSYGAPLTVVVEDAVEIARLAFADAPPVGGGRAADGRRAPAGAGAEVGRARRMRRPSEMLHPGLRTARGGRRRDVSARGAARAVKQVTRRRHPQHHLKMCDASGAGCASRMTHQPRRDVARRRLH